MSSFLGRAQREIRNRFGRKKTDPGFRRRHSRRRPRNDNTKLKPPPAVGKPNDADQALAAGDAA
jgi:hypothetical protein